LTVESTDYGVRYLCTSLKKKGKNKLVDLERKQVDREQVTGSVITFLKIRLFAL
jgi:hypothetical protein